MSLDEFCAALSKKSWSQHMMGVGLLWYFEKVESQTFTTPGMIAAAMRESGLANNPHSTNLGEAMINTGYVKEDGRGLKITPIKRPDVDKLFCALIGPTPPVVNQDEGYLPKAVWQGITKTYITQVAEEINGCTSTNSITVPRY